MWTDIRRSADDPTANGAGLQVTVGSLCTDAGELKELTHSYGGENWALQRVQMRVVTATEEE